MNDKSVTSFGNTTVTQTAHEIDLKVGPDIKIPPEVTFKDVKNETVLGDPNNMHITTGHTPYTPQGVDAIYPRFDTFWSAYPKKTGKADARKKFEKLVTDESTLSAILKSLEYLKTTEQWQKDSGKYIPYPATWLNQKRWEDETAQPPAELRKSKNLIPIYDREYTREELINGVVPKLIGWKEAGK